MKRFEKMTMLFGLAIALLIGGCASTPLARQDATSSSLVDLREAMIATRGQIEQTLTSLDALTNSPPDGVRAAYQQYAKDADTIAKQAVTVDKESRQMRQRSDAWLSGWQKSQANVENAELKAIGEQRRTLALNRFQNIEGSFAAAREAFTPFIANLQDVKTVLGSDVTSNGVAAVSGSSVVRNANYHGAAAARALDITIADLQAITETMSPSGLAGR